MTRCKSHFKRARKPEEIEQRRASILVAAAVLMEKEGFDKVSLNAIAREAGLAKSNVYRYFESREEIFIQLLKEDWKEWLDAIEGVTADLQGSNDASTLAHRIAVQTAASPRLCELMSVLASTLEQNLSLEAISSFKTETLQLATRLVTVILKVMPRLSPEKVAGFMTPSLALIAGLWPLCNTCPEVEEVMSRPEFVAFKPDFATSLEDSLRVFFTGMLQEANTLPA